MSDNLQRALPFARHGWYLFPAKWKDSKHHPLIKWGSNSSNDPAVVEKWGKRWPHCYFCVDLKRSDLTCVDVDDKKGKDGTDTLFELELEGKVLPKTLKSFTPSGKGEHHFFKGWCGKAEANILGRGVDTVVMTPLPGQVVEGKGFYRLMQKGPIQPLPEWVRLDVASKIRTRVENPQEAVIDLDLEQNIRIAEDRAKELPPVVEGEGADAKTIKIVHEIRQLGISEAECERILLEHWYPRCEPNNKPDFICRKVENAYRYGQDKPGVASPLADFQPIKPPEGHKAAAPESKPLFVIAGEVIRNMKPPEYVVDKYIEKDTVNLWFGEAGSFKSFLAIDMGLSVARGMKWAEQTTKPGPVFYVCGEGHGGISRRIKAYCIHHGISEKQSLDIPFYVSRVPHPVDSNKEANILIRGIKEECKKQGAPPALLIFDTLATSFGRGDENSTQDMQRYMEVIHGVRRALQCAVLLVHHVGHSEKDRPKGAYVLIARVDAHFKVERPSIHDNWTCLRQPRKMKDGIPPEDAWFNLENVEIGMTEELEQVTSLVPEYLPGFTQMKKQAPRGSNQSFIYRVVQENEDGVEYEVLKEEFRRWKEEEKQQVFDLPNFNKTLAKMVGVGLVKRHGDLVVHGIFGQKTE
jgi:hypothetical protein